MSLYITFKSGGVNFAMDAMAVSEVANYADVTPMPLTKPWIAGVANIRGSATSIVDFSVLMGGNQTGQGKFLVFDGIFKKNTAILVSSVNNIYSSEENLYINDGEDFLHSWAKDSIMINNREFIFIDVKRMMLDRAIVKFQAEDLYV